MSSRLALVLLLGAAICLGTGCRNTVEPFDSVEGPPFAVFGYLDTGRDTQTVRVEPVQPRVPFDTSRIGVALTDLTAGQQATMHPFVMPLEDGTTGLFYRTTLSVQPGHAYALEARVDDEVTTASVRVAALRPASIEGIVRDTTGQFVGASLLLAGPTTPPTRLGARYVVAVGGRVDSVVINYAGGQDRTDGYAYTLRLARDRLALLSRLGYPADTPARLLRFAVEIRDDGPEWGSAVTVNIRNGFGRFTTISRSEQAVVVPEALLREAGFLI